MLAQIDSRYIKARPSKLFSRLVSYALFEGRPLTTRGQWINPLIFAHFTLEKHLPQLKKVEKPVFILGTGRSGTTILGIILSMHKDVGFLNEPKAIWHSIYSKEDVIGSYDRGDARYRLDSRSVEGKTIQNAHKIFGAYLTSVFSKRLVDKYPELIFRVPFVMELFRDAQFIFLVRNGWDTCASIDKWSERLGTKKNGEVHDWWGANRRKWNLLVEQLVPEHADLMPYQEDMYQWQNYTDMAALEWIITMREGMNLERDYPNSVMRVNYEELCQRPGDNLHQITSFLGLSHDSTFLDYGTQVLQPARQHQPFDLAPEIKEIFEQTMRELGYLR